MGSARKDQRPRPQTQTKTKEQPDNTQRSRLATGIHHTPKPEVPALDPEFVPVPARGAQDPDLGPDIRRWFTQAGFEELSCEEWLEGTGMRVGVNRLVVPPQPLQPGEPIFSFYR